MKRSIDIFSFVAFVIGFVFLSFQILASRMVAPVVGTTIPVWASIIGSMLIGSSVGYYGGGVLADFRRAKQILALLLSLGGFLILTTSSLLKIFLPVVEHFSHGEAALILASVLFLPPAFLLSMASIYTIRIKLKKLAEVGEVHGKLYGIATFGSVIGLFSTSYIFIPHIAISNIATGLGALLLATALIVLAEEI